HAAFNPQTGMIYVPSAEECEKFFSGDTPHQQGRLWMGSMNESIPSVKPTGALRAFDARDGKLVWEFKTIHPHRGSVLTTAGDLVFAGDGQGYLTAFHARTGKVLWKFQAGAGVSGPPLTRSADDLRAGRPAIHSRDRRHGAVYVCAPDTSGAVSAEPLHDGTPGLQNLSRRRRPLISRDEVAHRHGAFAGARGLAWR